MPETKDILYQKNYMNNKPILDVQKTVRYNVNIEIRACMWEVFHHVSSKLYKSSG